MPLSNHILRCRFPLADRLVSPRGCSFLFLNLIFTLVFLFPSATFAATITSATSGYWNDIGTWIGGTIPSSTDSVVISSGHTVRFDRNDTSTTCGPITINSGGTLTFESTPSSPKIMQVKGDINVYGKLGLIPGSTLKIECETNGQYGVIVQSGGELNGTGSVPTVLTTLSAPLAIGGQTITVANASGFGVGDIITLGDNANAEGFTISAIAGSTITLNRKALNAQVAGAEVYKNATVTTSDISAGSRTFAVVNLGGIKAGDRIVIAATTLEAFWEPDQTEIRTVESVSSNLITVNNSLINTHASGAMIIKSNRDVLITSSYADRSHSAYLQINEGGSVRIEYCEISYLGSDYDYPGIYREWAIAGGGSFVFDSNSIHHNYYGIEIETCNNDQDINMNNNIFYSNINDGAYVNCDHINVLTNMAFLNGCNGIYQASGGCRNNYIAFNNCFENREDGFDAYAPNECLYIYNYLFYNRNNGMSEGPGNNTLVAFNELKDNSGGYYYEIGQNELLLLNKIINNDYGLWLSDGNNWWGIKKSLLVAEEVEGSKYNDINIESNDRPFAVELRNCDYTNVFGSLRVLGSSILFSSDKKYPEIFGDYNVSSCEVQKYNYGDKSFVSSATLPILLHGSAHNISTIETNDATTTTEVWFVTYRASTSNWEVKGTVSSLQSNRVTSGALYASDNGRVRFTLIQAAGVQEGDQFVFATIAAAGDANTQKKILFGPSAIAELDNQSRLTVDPGGKIELKGTAAYPTLIDYDGTGCYGVVISGEVDAQYFDFNQINDDGVKIDPTAITTKFDNGSIRNVSGLGPHLSVNGIDHIFNYLNFDNTGAYDVRASNDSNLGFIKAQRGKFLDSISDTSSISWDDPILGYTNDNALGTLAYNSTTQVLTVPFKIKDPNSSTCTFKSGSFQYSQNGGSTWRTVPDSDLTGISGPFSSNTDFPAATAHSISWNTATNYNNLEANLEVRFRVNNGYVYGDYGSSEAIPFNIKPPVVRVLTPNGGELFKGGAATTITWFATDEGSGVADNSIALYYNEGAGDILIADNLANTGSYNWAIPTMDSKQVRIKVKALDNVGASGEAVSANAFEIDSTPPVQPKINPVKTPTVLLNQALSGTKTTDASSILVNGLTTGAVYPTTTTWTYHAILCKGVNIFSVKARDAAGNDSAAVVATIEAKDAIFTDTEECSAVTVPIGASSEEVNYVKFERVDLPGPNPRGSLALEKAIKITSNISSFMAPVTITLLRPASASHPRVFIWDASSSKWAAMTIKNPAASLVTFDSSRLGIFAVVDIIDFIGPVFEDVKINGRSITSGDSIISKPSMALNISDNYGVDDSQTYLSIDGGQVKSLLSGDKSLGTGMSVPITYTFPNAEELSLGNHTFKIMTADEVGNASTWETTLCVVGESIPNLLVYPNPCKMYGSLIFEASDDIKVRIYDISGAFVWSGQSVPGTWKVSWDTKNSAGKSVVPAVYLYVVTSNSGGKQSGKIAIIR